MIKPYYDHAGITIYHGDCREVLEEMEDGSVDLVVTDPPYGVGYDGGHFHSGDVRIKRSREKLQGDNNTGLYKEVVPQMFRVCRGPCYVFFADTQALALYEAIFKNKGTIHAMIVWHKTNAKYAAMNSQYKQRHEPMLYCKGPKARTLWCGPSNECNVWNMKRKPQNTLHPTEKPVSLFVRAMSNHDASLVLDPFMGSGTTLVAAKELGRKAIGIEIEEKYCEIAVRRLAQEVLPL